MEGLPGPVFIEFPMDTLYSYREVSKGYGRLPGDKSTETESEILSKKTNIMSKFAKWCYERQLRYLFAGAWTTRYNFAPLKVNIPLPQADQISRVISILSTAKRPLVNINILLI